MPFTPAALRFKKIYIKKKIPICSGKITPWCRVLLEKLTISQPIKKLPSFY
jgi:hypothetical protein